MITALSAGYVAFSLSCTIMSAQTDTDKTLTAYNSKRIYPFDFKLGTLIQCIKYYSSLLLHYFSQFVIYVSHGRNVTKNAGSTIS